MTKTIILRAEKKRKQNTIIDYNNYLAYGTLVSNKNIIHNVKLDWTR